MADYLYKDIEEVEKILGNKVNDVFRDAWRLARMTKSDLEKVAKNSNHIQWAKRAKNKKESKS